MSGLENQHQNPWTSCRRLRFRLGQVVGVDPALRAKVPSSMADPIAFRELASDADVSRPLGVSLCRLEAGPPKDRGSLSFFDLGWPGCTPLVPSVAEEAKASVKLGAWPNPRHTDEGHFEDKGQTTKYPRVVSLPQPHRPEVATTQVSFYVAQSSYCCD